MILITDYLTKIRIQSTLDKVTLDLREIRYKVQIFVLILAAPISGIMLRPFEIREIRFRSKIFDAPFSLLYRE